MSQITLGPWTYTRRKDGSLFVTIGEYPDGVWYRVDVDIEEPDLKLACAAPDLLEHLKEYRTQYGCGCGHPHCKRCQMDWAADEVIRKAEGGGA